MPDNEEINPTHVIRIYIRCPKDADVLQWFSLIADARYRKGCVCASLEPILDDRGNEVKP